MAVLALGRPRRGTASSAGAREEGVLSARRDPPWISNSWLSLVDSPRLCLPCAAVHTVWSFISHLVIPPDKYSYDVAKMDRYAASTFRYFSRTERRVNTHSPAARIHRRIDDRPPGGHHRRRRARAARRARPRRRQRRRHRVLPHLPRPPGRHWTQLDIDVFVRVDDELRRGCRGGCRHSCARHSCTCARTRRRAVFPEPQTEQCITATVLVQVPRRANAGRFRDHLTGRDAC